VNASAGTGMGSQAPKQAAEISPCTNTKTSPSKSTFEEIKVIESSEIVRVTYKIQYELYKVPGERSRLTCWEIIPNLRYCLTCQNQPPFSAPKGTGIIVTRQLKHKNCGTNAREEVVSPETHAHEKRHKDAPSA
jgi:hypothetical protein